ncbi:MAG: U32 family peptidase [Ruminococcaceae bacterium]|nr:U32 family peptidase [Oscillospiraceae bacterium]
MTPQTLEILSPAGGYEAFCAAVDNGADAIYLGGRQFSARAGALNFSEQEMEDAFGYAHLRGVKVYVAVNTLLSDSELKDAYHFIDFCYRAGADALIVQDTGLARMVRQCFPDLPLHASTQMTICTPEGVKRAQKLGFSRVVLARELTKTQIAHIAGQTDAELEVFVHGALCMSYSGQCLMSSIIGGCSGNRGGCKQPCRLPYTLTDLSGAPISDGAKYLLSPRDLCLIDHLDDLQKMGITSAKIEGRMKGAAYVGAVTGVYRDCRDRGYVTDADRATLKNAFCRSEFTKGHFGGVSGRELLKYDADSTGIYDTFSSEMPDRERLISLTGCATICAGAPAALTITDADGNTVAVTGEMVQQAKNAPLTEERIAAALEKTGGTAYRMDSISVSTCGNAFLPASALNALRRDALEQLDELRLAPYKRGGAAAPFPKIENPHAKSPFRYTAEVCTLEQARALLKTDLAAIYLPYGVFDQNREWAMRHADRLIVKLPSVPQNDTFHLPGHMAIAVGNHAQVGLDCPDKTADFPLNLFNSHALAQAAEDGFTRACLSPELTVKQIAALKSPIPLEAVVYGRLPLMTMKNCTVKSAVGCPCDGWYALTDRKGISFPLKPDPTTHQSVLYNSAPIYMAERMNEIRRSGVSFGRLIFTTESPDEAVQVVEAYRNGDKPQANFTRGHYYRGV